MSNYINDTSGNFNPVNPRQLAMQTKNLQSAGGGKSMFDDIMSVAGPAVDTMMNKSSGGMGSAVISAATGLGSSSKFLSFGGNSKNLGIQAPPGFSGGGGVGGIGSSGVGGNIDNFLNESTAGQMFLLQKQVEVQTASSQISLLSNLIKTDGETRQRMIQNIRQG